MGEDLNLRYVERHFWAIEELADAAGEAVPRIGELIAAGCAPKPVYGVRDGHWSSALEEGFDPSAQDAVWHSRGSVWCLRRALAAGRAGASDVEAASLLRRTFAVGFAEALATVEGARLAFPRCFAADAVDPAAASAAASREWDDWLDGGYGVCLRTFTARNCVAKEALAASLKAALAEGAYDQGRLLQDAEALADLMLPFAPWQRESGTPGRTIDRLLAEQRLGRERHYEEGRGSKS